MNKIRATKIAIDLAQTALAASDGNFYPNEGTASNLADFIETLSKRLESMTDTD